MVGVCPCRCGHSYLTASAMKGNKMKKKTAFFCLLIIALSLVLSSCTDDEEYVRYDSVSLSEKAITLRVGDSFTLNADTVYSAGEGELYWQSSDNGVEVSADGVITGVIPGKYTVKAYTANGGADICTVTVKAAGDSETDQGSEGEELDLESLVNLEIRGLPGSYKYFDKNSGDTYTEQQVLSYDVHRSYYPATSSGAAYIYITVTFKCVKTYDIDGETGGRKAGLSITLYKENDVFCDKKITKKSVRVGEEFEFSFSFKAGTDGVSVRDFYIVLEDASL